MQIPSATLRKQNASHKSSLQIARDQCDQSNKVVSFRIMFLKPCENFGKTMHTRRCCPESAVCQTERIAGIWLKVADM